MISLELILSKILEFGNRSTLRAPASSKLHLTLQERLRAPPAAELRLKQNFLYFLFLRTPFF